MTKIENPFDRFALCRTTCLIEPVNSIAHPG